jgi:cysteine desulfurase
MYLDFAASTPPADEVVDAMLPWLRAGHANPHSVHWHGHRASQAVDQARHHVAELIHAEPRDIVFTSGATEANNLALKGLLSGAGPRRHLWLSGIEHKSLLEPAHALAAAGVTVTILPVDSRGQIVATGLRDLLSGTSSSPGLVALTHGNNEIGTVQAVEDVAPQIRREGHLLHLDASQSAAWEPLDVGSELCDLLALSSHKLYGPAGIGALYISPAVRADLQPQLHGGGQEGGTRSGTIPLFLAVGFGVAARIARERQEEAAAHLRALIATFLACLREGQTTYRLIGDPVRRLPGHLSLRFFGVEAEDLLAVLSSTLSASTGSACTAGELRASSVLRTLGLDERAAGEVVRLTFGRLMTQEQVLWAAQELAGAVRRVRNRSN